jgi:hypothetical protein
VRPTAAAWGILLPGDVQHVELACLAGNRGQEHHQLFHQEQVSKVAIANGSEMFTQQFTAMHRVEHVIGAEAALPQPLRRGIGDVGGVLAAALPIDGVAVEKFGAGGGRREPEHRALTAAGHVTGIGLQEFDGARQRIGDEQVIVVGHQHQRRRDARQRIGELGEIVRVAGIERIADVLDIHSLRFLFVDQ